MPSEALQRWETVGARELDEIESAHSAVGGAGPGRRYATQQINLAYVVMLSSQFQRCCRDLHTEAAQFLADHVGPPAIQGALLSSLVKGRKLDFGNPNAGNLAADFGRFGMQLWTEIATYRKDGHRWLRELESLNKWRNAIAHQDFDPTRLGGRTTIGLRHVRRWRATCNGLAAAIDRRVAEQVSAIIGIEPW